MPWGEGVSPKVQLAPPISAGLHPGVIRRPGRCAGAGGTAEGRMCVTLPWDSYTAT